MYIRSFVLCVYSLCMYVAAQCIALYYTCISMEAERCGVCCVFFLSLFHVPCAGSIPAVWNGARAHKGELLEAAGAHREGRRHAEDGKTPPQLTTPPSPTPQCVCLYSAEWQRFFFIVFTKMKLNEIIFPDFSVIRVNLFSTKHSRHVISYNSEVITRIS